MTKQTINVGTTANDGTGDTLRAASIKINSNFTELYNQDEVIDSRINSSYNKANAANTLASAAFNFANTIISDTQIDPFARETANAGFLQANSANVLATSSYTQANAATESAQAGYEQANSANVLSTSSFTQANSANVLATSSFTQSNSANVLATSSYTQANVANVLATYSFTQANAANVLATSSFTQANAATDSAQAGYDQANSANVLATSSYTQANASNVFAHAAFAYANTLVSDTFIDPFARETANAGFLQANSANNIAVTGYNQANAANVLAQAAFHKANTGVDIGDLVISGGWIGTSGVSNISIDPNGEGYAYITVPNNTSAISGAATVIGNDRNGGGGVQVTAYNNTWQFKPDGTMLFPNDKIKVGDSFAIQAANTIPTGVDNWEGGGGWNEMEYINLSTTGGTGSGLTVDVAAGGGGYISINEITINNPGSGYTDGDVITINNENNIPGTFNIVVPQRIWLFDTDGSLTFPDATVQTTAFTGRSINGTDTSNVTVNLNGTVSLTTDDGDDNIATWTYDAEGNIILPADAGLVTTDSVTIGYYDITASSAVGALASFYSTTANNAVVEIAARNDNFHQNKVQIISDGATGEDYVNIELYDGGQTYGTSSWKFHKSGILESAIATTPITSVGILGDKRGMIIHTPTHMYFCTADYDGTTDIWRRMEWNASDTW